MTDRLRLVTDQLRMETDRLRLVIMRVRVAIRRVRPVLGAIDQQRKGGADGNDLEASLVNSHCARYTRQRSVRRW